MVDLPSATSIANNAIARVGSTTVLNSIGTGNEPSAIRIRNAWPQLRRVMLVQHPFNFAIKRDLLNPSSAPVAFGSGLTAYRLPDDYLRWLPSQSGLVDDFDGELENGHILTRHEGPLALRYIYDNADVTRWSAGFVEGFTEALAKLLAEPVTQSAAMAQWLHDTAREAIRLAKRIDGLETGRNQRQGVVVRSDWLLARGRGRLADHR